MADVLPGWNGRYSRRIVAWVLSVKGTDCHLCPDRSSPATTADHLIPRSKGGDDSLGNLEPAHAACNYARGDRSLADWWATHPRPTRTPLAPSRRWLES